MEKRLTTLFSPTHAQWRWRATWSCRSVAGGSRQSWKENQNTRTRSMFGLEFPNGVHQLSPSSMGSWNPPSSPKITLASAWSPLSVRHFQMATSFSRIMTRSTQASLLKHLLKTTNINWWKTPLGSPDMNPIELVWHEMKHYLRKYVKPKTKEELMAGLEKFWVERMTPDKCAKYISHLRKVIAKVIEREGRASGYWVQMSRRSTTIPNDSFRSHQINKRYDQFTLSFINCFFGVQFWYWWFTECLLKLRVENACLLSRILNKFLFMCWISTSDQIILTKSRHSEKTICDPGICTYELDNFRSFHNTPFKQM